MFAKYNRIQNLVTPKTLHWCNDDSSRNRLVVGYFVLFPNQEEKLGVQGLLGSKFPGGRSTGSHGGWTRRLDVCKVVLPVLGQGVLCVEHPMCARLPTPSHSKGVPSPAPEGLRGRGSIMRVGLPLKVGGGETTCGPAAGRPGYSAAPEPRGPNTLRQGFPEPRTHCQGGASSADGLHVSPSKQSRFVFCDAARKGQRSWVRPRPPRAPWWPCWDYDWLSVATGTNDHKPMASDSRN